MFEEQSKDLKLFISDKIDPLTVQVTKTNGRVKFLERFMWSIVGMATLFTFLYTQGFINLVDEVRLQALIDDAVHNTLYVEVIDE
jgi:hypothetical protein